MDRFKQKNIRMCYKSRTHTHEEIQPCKHNRSKKKGFRIPDLTRAQISDSRFQLSSEGREERQKGREGEMEKG